MQARKMLICAAGVAMFGLFGAAIAPPAGSGSESATGAAVEKAQVGKPAPDFALQDAQGKTYRLSDFKGKNVVLQWINPGCPVCVRVSSTGLVEDMRTQLKAIDKDYVHLAINSSHFATAQDSAKYLKSHELEMVPALDDHEGTVGRLYGAKTTPHMYVIDAKGILRYQGAFDDDTSGRKSEKMNYAVNALKQIQAGETVTPAETRAYGCSVKYKK